MKLKTLLIAISAAIGGIYLTSEEGKKAREALRKKKSSFEPIIKSLIKDANAILDGTKKMESEVLKANIELLVDQAKQILLDIDLETTMETIQQAIKVASIKIRKAANEKQSTIRKASSPSSRKKILKATKNT